MTDFERCERNKDMATQEDFFELTLNWKGNDYPCIASSKTTVLNIQPGSNGTSRAVKLSVRKELLPSVLPVAGREELTYDSQVWLIKEVETSIDGIAVKFYCLEDNVNVHG